MRVFETLICVLLLTPLSLMAQVSDHPAGSGGIINYGGDGSRLPDYNLRYGAVYVMTNREQNGVLALAREPGGFLMPVGHFSTGGAGDPTVRQAGETLYDPLASQRSLVMADDHSLLIACNAGDNTITVFRIGTRPDAPAGHRLGRQTPRERSGPRQYGVRPQRGRDRDTRRISDR